MLGIRVVPCLDITNGRVVKGTKFLELKDAGNPIDIANYYSENGADEIIFLDITATFEQRKTTIDLIDKTAKKVFIPLTVGGGIKTLFDIRNILNAGADKVAINSAAVADPKIISQASNMFGKQCIVVAIDAKKVGLKKWNVFTHGGRINTGIDAVEWAISVTLLGAGEILLTSMDKDGTKDGYDIELLNIIAHSTSIPIIASGGAGELKHFLEAYSAGASAILVASLFHYKELTIKQVKQYLQSHHIPVRL
ncbi:MAG: imidazole glycerol phosphate synthase subunit HisF [Endomicrobium sp.]|jgi:cyclase|nr:imidazole glycerol phosphate synthase subunit HisF [Endomicrobium sp.]